MIHTMAVPYAASNTSTLYPYLLPRLAPSNNGPLHPASTPAPSPHLVLSTLRFVLHLCRVLLQRRHLLPLILHGAPQVLRLGGDLGALGLKLRAQPV